MAVWKFASCDGRQLTLLDMEDHILPLTDVLQIACFPEATSGTVRGPYDLSLFEGSIPTPLWRDLAAAMESEYKGVPKAYASVLEAQRGLEDYFRFCNGLRPHQALGYRTPAEVFLGSRHSQLTPALILSK